MNSERYHIAYLRSIGKNVGEISMEYSNKMTSEILDVLIEIGFNGEHITKEFARKFWPVDKSADMVLKLISLSDTYLYRIVDLCKSVGIYDVLFKYAHLFPDDGELAELHRYKMLTQDLTSESCKKMSTDDINFCCQMAFMVGDYQIADIIYPLSSQKIDLTLCNKKTIPERYFRLRPDQYKSVADFVCIYNRMDLVYIMKEKIGGKIFRESLCYDKISVELYRYIRSVTSLSKNNNYYHIAMHNGDSLFEELVSDKEFIQELDRNCIRIIYAVGKGNHVKMIDYIMINYRDQIEAHLQKKDISKLVGKIPYLELPYRVADAFEIIMKCLARYEFSHEIILSYCEEQPSLYNHLLPIINMHSVPDSIMTGLKKAQQKVFLLHKRRQGIRNWAQRMMTMIVLYCDGYFVIRCKKIHQYHHRFFEFIARLPLAAQSIIAFRYAWLPNCETILLKDSDFYCELASQ